MTEEIIIDCAFYKDGVCASPINKTCEYCKNIDVSKCYHKQLKRLKQENEELKEWKTKVVMLFESACRCKYLNEETDICSYTNEKCMNINKCVYKYQNLSETYRSALEEIRELVEKSIKISYNLEVNSMLYDITDKIKEVLE